MLPPVALMVQESRVVPSAVVDGDRPSDAAVWWQAIRPATLLASVPPVLVGGALAEARDRFQPLAALIFFVSFMLLQITSNLVNDAADYTTGADGADRLGPARMAQKGWLSQRALVIGAVLAIAFSLVGIGLLAQIAGPAVWIGGAVSILGAVGYTAGPVRFGYLGYGDLMVFFYFGVVALGGHYYVQTGGLDAAPVLACAAVGCHATAILVVNNLRDRVSDARVGKRTLVVRWGEGFGRVEYTALVLVPYALTTLPAIAPGWFGLLPWLSAPWALHLVRRVQRSQGADLNPLLGETARLGLMFAVLLACGIVVGAWSAR